MTGASRGFLLQFGLLLLSIAVSACSTDRDELWRVTSPDTRVDAVLVRVGGPATVGFSYRLFIVPRGEHPGTSGEILVADHVENLTAVWQKPRVLEIRYDQARIFSFANFWHAKEVDDFNYVVELRLAPARATQLPATSN